MIDRNTECLQEVQKALAELAGPSKAVNLQELAGSPEDCAKVHMGLAFAINSLFYCKWLGCSDDDDLVAAMMRVQGKTKQLTEGHPVMDQIQRVKLRYMKLNSAVEKAGKAQQEGSRLRIDKEATERIVRNALGSQIKQDEVAERSRHRAKKNLLSDSEDSQSANETK